MTSNDSSENADSGLTHGAYQLPESVLKALFYSNPLPMWIYELDSLRFVAVNDSALEHYDYSRATFLSMTIADIRPQGDVPALLANVGKVQDQLDRAGVWRHLRQDGSLIFVEVTSYPLDFEGRPAELVIAYDVSARVAAEDNLHHLVGLEALIADISRALADNDNVDQAIDEALQKIGFFSQASRSYLFQFDAANQFMNNTHEWCAKGVQPQKGILQNLSTDEFKWSLSLLREGKTIPIAAVDQLPAAAQNERQILEQQGVRSLILVPVYRATKVTGFIGFDNVVVAASKDSGAQRLLGIAAETIGSALQRRADRDALLYSAQQMNSIMRSAEHFVFYRLGVNQEEKHGGYIEFVSDSLQSIVGVRPDAPFDTWFSRVHADDLPHLEAENTRVAISGEPLDLTVRMFHPLREKWRWIRAVSNPVRDAAGQLRHFNGFLLDVTDSVEAARTVQAERDFANAVMDTVGALVIVMGRKGEIVRFNRACERITGYDFAEVEGRLVWDLLLLPEEREGVKKVFSELKQIPIQSQYENTWISKDGRQILISWSNTAILDSQGGLLYGIGTGIDVTERRQAESAIRKLSSAVDQTANGVIIIDERGIVEYVNPAYLAISGQSEASLVGKPTLFLGTPEDSSHQQPEIWQHILTGRNWRGELQQTDQAGTIRWISVTASPVHSPESKTTHFAILVEDISELKRAQENLERLASFDTLTGLPNRRLFRDRLEHGLSAARRRGSQLALLYLDLDNFKRVNDSLGHDAGDSLLCEIANRLSSCVREEDTVARLGGDEFVILAQTRPDSFDAGNLAKKILAKVKVPVMAADHEVVITASIGITMTPMDSSDSGTLLRNADLAMYRSKSRGRDAYEFFKNDMNLEVSRRLSMEAELRQALKFGQLRPAFQPIVRLKDLQIVGFEALARWEHPEQGFIPPDQFIPVAEDCGLIGPLGETLLECAASELLLIRKAQNADLFVAVNLSARQAQEGTLGDLIINVLKRTGLPAQALHLEITESLLMKDFELARRLLERLRETLGTRVAIDDFGTGYSSLSYLKRLPIDTLKVDRSFVKDIPGDQDDMEITAAIIAMAQALQKSVVAEGIETLEQLKFLQFRGCEFGQGYLFGKPSAPKQFLHSSLLLKPLV